MNNIEIKVLKESAYHQEELKRLLEQAKGFSASISRSSAAMAMLRRNYGFWFHERGDTIEINDEGNSTLLVVLTNPAWTN